MEDLIKDINKHISDFVEGEIDERELYQKILPYNNTETREKLVRTGNFIVVVILQYIFELSYSISNDEETEKDRKDGLSRTIEEYYNEYKARVAPQYTKMNFTYNWNSPGFKLHVENG
jgi:protein tyrosine phosphatase